MNLPICLLVDNGSLRPSPILTLRQIAKKLNFETPFEVLPMGLLHSNKVDLHLLEGKPAETIKTFLKSDRGTREKDLLVLPFFLGPSLGVTDWLVSLLEYWKNEKKDRSFTILNCLHQDGDERLAFAMKHKLNQMVSENDIKNPSVAMVDHGTPIIQVNQVREAVGKSLKQMIHDQFKMFSTCSMERRDGEEYNFNDPLLEDLLEKWLSQGEEEIIVLLFFLLSGRHAGDNGDIAKICKRVGMKYPKSKILVTKPLGNSEIVFDILKDQLLMIAESYVSKQKF